LDKEGAEKDFVNNLRSFYEFRLNKFELNLPN
jgi:hypothetical protein